MRVGPRRGLAPKFTPFDAPGLWSWWDFGEIVGLFTDNAATTKVTADGDRIGYAKDKSGNSRPLTTGTASRKGQYKTNIVGNKSANLLASDADADAIDTAGTLTTSDCTIAVAFKSPGTISGGTAYGVLGAYHSTNGGARIYISTAGAICADVSPTTGTCTGPTASTSSLYVAVLSVRSSNPTRTLNVNGVLYTDNTAVSAPAQLIRLGSVNNNNNASFWTGHVLEAVVYQPALSNTQVQKLVDYLNHKWGIYR